MRIIVTKRDLRNLMFAVEASEGYFLKSALDTQRQDLKADLESRTKEYSDLYKKLEEFEKRNK